MGQTVNLVAQFGAPTFTSLRVIGNTTLGNNLVVSGSITAQSLIVNSTSVYSGSTQFGNIISNTHQFTGSILTSGSITVVGQYNGSGAGLTGTATSLNIGGTSSNITAYTINQNVGTSNSPTFDQVLSTNNGNGTNYRVGDDAWIGDVNAANTIRVKGIQDATAGYITFGNQATQLGLINSTTLTWGAAFTATGNVTAFSDARVKTNIKTIDNALLKVLALRGVTYNRTDLEDKSEQIGVIAQEIKEILPQVVQENNGYYSVAYGNIVGILIEAIKEQQTQIEELKLRL